LSSGGSLVNKLYWKIRTPVRLPDADPVAVW
jgi:hypothetical protein